MRNIFVALAAVLLFVGCEKESGALKFSVVESDIESLSDSSVTLTAMVNASDFGKIKRLGFAISRSGSDAYDYYDANISRLITVTIDNLEPNTEYHCMVFARTANDGWQCPIDNFKTLPTGSEPEQPEEPERPDEQPVAGNSYRTGWFELPIEADNDKDGVDDNNSSYYYAHHLCGGSEQNAQRSGRARNYSVCFSAEHHCPVWVAAPRHSMYVGSASRTDAYTQDPQIPSDIQYYRKDADSGCNNGHMLGSAERTSSSATNRQVFYFSNIAPQYTDTFNTGGGAWNNLEDHIDGLVCADTLYTVIGCYFDTYTDKYGNTGTPKKISFGGRSDVSKPTMFYYALLRTKSGRTGKSVANCSASELQCAAFVICHKQDKGHKPQSKDIISIEELEKLTGFTYFNNVPNAPKSVVNASDWL